MSSQPAFPSEDLRPEDLLILLSVSRTGRFTEAARALELNHTTVSRRIARLEAQIGGPVLERTASGWELTTLGERACQVAEEVEAALAKLSPASLGERTVRGVVRVSATDGFSAYILPKAYASVQERYPEVQLELVTVTRHALQKRSGMDIEIVVGKPEVATENTRLLARYALGLYGSREYLREHGRPQSVSDAATHKLVYFVDSLLKVDELDVPRRLIPGMQNSMSATNVLVQLAATRAGSGLGFLPCYIADDCPDLERVLPAEIEQTLEYWVVSHPDSLQREPVRLVLDAIAAQLHQLRGRLRGSVSRSS